MLEIGSWSWNWKFYAIKLVYLRYNMSTYIRIQGMRHANTIKKKKK